MRHIHSGIPTYGLNGLEKGDDYYGIFTFTFFKNHRRNSITCPMNKQVTTIPEQHLVDNKVYSGGYR